jgi:hypothetical protein
MVVYNQTKLYVPQRFASFHLLQCQIKLWRSSPISSYKFLFPNRQYSPAGIGFLRSRVLNSVSQTPLTWGANNNCVLVPVLPSHTHSAKITNFSFTMLFHIPMKAEVYTAHPDLTQCYNCQRLGHDWVYCIQPPRFLWCGLAFAR